MLWTQQKNVVMKLKGSESTCVNRDGEQIWYSHLNYAKEEGVLLIGSRAERQVMLGLTMSSP